MELNTYTLTQETDKQKEVLGKVEQLLRDKYEKMCMLQNDCCFPSTTQISQEFPLWLSLNGNREKGSPGKGSQNDLPNPQKG